MQPITRYEDLLENYSQQKDPGSFREQHFQQWSITKEGCCYCVSRTGNWNFFGFVLSSDQQVLCIAVNDKKEFLYCRLKAETLQNRVERQIHIWKIPHNQSWQNSLLDLVVAHPLFLEQFAWRMIPGGLELWDENQILILVAQLALPLEFPEPDPELDLSCALFNFMEESILDFLEQAFPVAQLGEYRFLWEASTLEERGRRMQLLLSRRFIVPRFLLEDL